MKKLKEYFLEALSAENIKKLEEYINNDNINDVINMLVNHSNKASIKGKEYEDFFDLHGLSKLNWGRKNSALAQFTNVFSDNGHLDIFKNIIKNNGIVNIDDLNSEGNIFKDYCGDNEKLNPCGNFIDEAKTIASWTNSTSANAGPGEILLKFILKEGRTSYKGDVAIAVDENDPKPNEEMEVKAATLAKNASGGHAAGQTGKIRNAWSIYWFLDNKLFNLKTLSTDADKLQYFQNQKVGLKDFNQKIKDANIEDPRIISDGIVNALCYQYRFIQNETSDKPENLNGYNKLKEQAYKLCNKIYDKNNGFKSAKDLYNLVGCIQLYLYSQVEQFDYFFAILIDKNIDNESADNGKYWCVKNCNTDETDLLDFDKVLSHLQFKCLDSTTSSQGRTGKIIIKK